MDGIVELLLLELKNYLLENQSVPECLLRAAKSGAKAESEKAEFASSLAHMSEQLMRYNSELQGLIDISELSAKYGEAIEREIRDYVVKRIKEMPPSAEVSFEPTGDEGAGSQVNVEVELAVLSRLLTGLSADAEKTESNKATVDLLNLVREEYKNLPFQ